MSGDVWLTLPDAAGRVGRSLRTMRSWVARGELRPILGRVRESDVVRVDRVMRARRAAGRPKGSSSSSAV